MIKRYSQFILENQNKRPGNDIEGSMKIDITGEEMDLFATEPQLQKLIADEKVSVLDCEVWYRESDKDTLEVLDQYFEINKKVTESNDFDDKKIEEWQLKEKANLEVKMVKESHIDDDVFLKISKLQSYNKLRNDFKSLVDDFTSSLENEDWIDLEDNDHVMAVNAVIQEALNESVF